MIAAQPELYLIPAMWMQARENSRPQVRLAIIIENISTHAWQNPLMAWGPWETCVMAYQAGFGGFPQNHVPKMASIEQPTTLRSWVQFTLHSFSLMFTLQAGKPVAPDTDIWLTPPSEILFIKQGMSELGLLLGCQNRERGRFKFTTYLTAGTLASEVDWLDGELALQAMHAFHDLQVRGGLLLLQVCGGILLHAGGTHLSIVGSIKQ